MSKEKTSVDSLLEKIFSEDELKIIGTLTDETVITNATIEKILEKF